MAELWWYAKRSQWVADVRCPETGKRSRWYLRSDERAARRAYHLRMAELVSPTAPPTAAVTVAELADAYLQWCTVNREPSTVRFRQTYLRWLLKTPALAALPAPDLSPRDIEAIKARRRERNSARAINAFVGSVKAMYSWGIDQGMVMANPVRAVKALPREAPTPKALPHEQVLAALALCDTAPPLGDVCRVLYHTGMRVGELLALPWSAHDEDRGLLLIRHHKTAGYTGRSREIPLLPETAAILARQPRTGEAIFSQANGRAVTADGLWSALRRLRKAHAAALAGFNFHALRWSFASRARNLGALREDVQRALGHASSRLTDRYTVLEAATVRRVSALVVGGEKEGATERPPPGT